MYDTDRQQNFRTALRRYIRFPLVGLLLLPAGMVMAEGQILPAGVSQVARDVFFRLGNVQRDQCNSGYIIGKDYVIAIDAPNRVAAEEMLAEIKQLTDKPVRYLIITHGHYDHDGGVETFVQQGATVICHEALRQRYAGEKKVGTFLGARDTLTLTCGETEVRILAAGATAHSATDLFVMLPQQGVLFTGDCAVNSPYLWLGESDIEQWITTVEVLRKLGATVVCPGHGPVSGPELLDRLAQYLTALRNEVAYQICQGRSLAVTRQQVQVPGWETWAYSKDAFLATVDAVYARLTKAPSPSADPRAPRALALIGDYFHRPGYIRPALEAALGDIGMPVEFVYDVTQLNADSLPGVRLLIVLRDGANRPDPAGQPVMWMTAEQEKALADFVRNGGGFVALHNATALKCLDDTPCLYRDLLGCSYNQHGPADEQFTVRVVNTGHPIIKGVTDYPAIDERHTPILHAKDATLLLESVSGDKHSLNGYASTYGNGRVCYLATGHTREMLALPAMRRLLGNAAAWCSGVVDTRE